MLVTEQKRATIEDYETLPEGSPYQLIGGELVMSPSLTVQHQSIAGSILLELNAFVESNSLGEVFIGPLDIRLTNEDVYQPDLLFVRKERVHLIGRQKFNIVPDLVVEILSPSNAYYDLTRKKAMYAEHGVAEYWIVDPHEETIEILVKEGAYYRTDALFRKSDTLASPMFAGFSMKIATVFAF